MNVYFYKKILQNLKTAYAYHKIICMDDGIPDDYEFIEVNAEFEKLTGLQGPDIIGKRISEVLPGIKSDKFDWISIYSDVALQKSERAFEQYSESFKKYFKVKVFSPRKFYFVTLFDEVSMDNQTLATLIADQEHFEMICDLDAEVVLTIRMNDEMIINANKLFSESLGYAHYEFVGKSCLEAGLFANPLQYQKIIVDLRENGSFTNKEITFRRKDGSEFIRCISGEKISICDDSYVFNSIRNSIDCKELEGELVASELRYRRLFESAKEGILILDAATGYIIDVNQFLIDLLGYSKEQFMNKAIWDIGFFRDAVESKEKYLELLLR